MRFLAVPVLTISLLGLAACGGDDEPDLADVQDLLEDLPTSVSTTGDSTTGDSDDGSGDSGSSSSGSTGDASAFLNDDDCNFVLTGGFAAPFASGFTPGATGGLAESSQQIKNIADNAPSEIKDEFQIIADAYSEFAETFKDIDFSNPATLSDPSVAGQLSQIQGIFDAEFEAASEKVSDYFDENCSSS